MRLIVKTGVLLSLLVVFLAASVSVSAADRLERHALIIGNSNYADGQALLNPVNDATDMANQLGQMGYKIHGGGPALDLDRVGIERTLRAFAQQLPQGAHALFYYAGHGMATKDDNFLIPVNHNLEFQEQLPDRTVSLRSAVDLLKNANPDGINVVLLDACRDNPLSRSFRSAREGLTRLNDIPQGVFVGYAADFGQLADDGISRNGTYTGELLSVLREKPNVIIELAHKEVASRVYEKTGGKQFPVSENKVYGNWCFGNCSDPLVSSSAAPATLATPATPAAKTRTNRWLIAGGVVAAVVLAGALYDPGSDNPPASPTTDPVNDDQSFTINLTPP